MRYSNGEEMNIGDEVVLENGEIATVAWLPNCAPDDFDDVVDGVVVKTRNGANIHYGEEFSHLITKSGL